MPIKPHPKFEEIEEALRLFCKQGKPFAGVCYRCVESQFVHQVITGEGSRLYGARWTPKNSFPSVYLCQTAEMALQEYLARGRRMKLSDHKSLPMMMVSVKLKVANFLDITDMEVASVINPILETEKNHWRVVQDRREAISQAVGRAIKEMGFSGIAVPSQVSSGHKNIVIFPGNLVLTDILSTPGLKPLP
ncbi:MAG TPA: RES family NAD+ phosphorylase [Verrucomicrobiae bacterium]